MGSAIKGNDDSPEEGKEKKEPGIATNDATLATYWNEVLASIKAKNGGDFSLP